MGMAIVGVAEGIVPRVAARAILVIAVLVIAVLVIAVLVIAVLVIAVMLIAVMGMVGMIARRAGGSIVGLVARALCRAGSADFRPLRRGRGGTLLVRTPARLVRPGHLPLPHPIRPAGPTSTT
ncbi:hypothetical protein V5F38_18330 [Xanthobacter sp. V0B-10]|uniref:hypothetical protein n=1 Tax=Xanthobacter albus TaxID=3119929 RepID=UPI0037268AD0